MKNVGVYRAWEPAPWSAAPWRERALYRLAALDWPQLAGRLLRRGVRTLQAPLDAKARVLLLTKGGFTEDAVGALSRLDDVAVSTLDRPSIKAMARAFLPVEVDDNNYRSASPSAQEQMIKYRAYLTRMWPAFDPERSFGMVMTGNFGYFAEQELAATLEELGVPFVALHKENLKSAGKEAFWERVYRERRGTFRGRRILVYQPGERDLQVRAGIVDQERVEIVGMPRLDDAHKWRIGNVSKVPAQRVLFFSFQPMTGMPAIKRKGASRAEGYVEFLEEAGSQINLQRLSTEVHRAMFELACRCSDIEVVIKSKSKFFDHATFLLSAGLAKDSEVPPNLRIVGGGTPLPILEETAVACGYNSTALLEALAMGRPVVVPAFAEAADPAVALYSVDLGEAVIRAVSPTDLVEKLVGLARERRPVPASLEPEAVSVLQQWAGNSDGRASERAAAAIEKLLWGNGAVMSAPTTSSRPAATRATAA